MSDASLRHTRNDHSARCSPEVPGTEESIRAATAAGNFQEAADGISDMRSLMESFGIEVNEGAVANMTRLEDLLRQAIARGLELDGATDGTASNMSAAANEASRLMN